MGKESPSPPPVPDPVATAAAQSTSNVNTAAAQAALNNVNQYTPYGSTTYQPTGSYTTPSGETVPTYTQSTSLSPLSQTILTGTQGVAADLLPTADNLVGQIGSAASKPLDFNTPFSDTLNKGPQLLDQNVTDALYGQQKSFLDPQWNQQSTLLQDQLSRQGIPVGSDAYNNAMEQLNNSKTQAYQSAQDSAIGAGSGAATNMFNMALAGQQQNIGQQQTGQTQPIGLLQSLFGATPPSPQQPISAPGATAISPTDIIGATGLSTNAAQNAYGAQVSAANAQSGGEAALGGATLVGGAILI